MPKKSFGHFLTRLRARLSRDPDIRVFEGAAAASKGQGFVFNGAEFVHHSDLPHHKTALQTVTSRQKIWISGLIAVFLIAALLDWRAALFGLIVIVTILYAADLVFNFALIWRSFTRNPEISFAPGELESFRDEDAPRYTIFCPLYREWAVLPQFVQAISAMEYPKDKLQVLLLLEEDDAETIEHARAAQLPPYMEVVVVPHSMPKTKPKAMNYGLKLTTGEYVTIYDAEDMPDPLQLKKAVLAFGKCGPEFICIQSKLNFYNPEQNFVTRLFTAEYSLWFDLVLPGLQTLGAPIPLGGTSNHFRTADLRRLQGWDAFNVTEDCDLGMRLAKDGFRTAIMESTTYEEANSDMKNWYRQRSRWIKGYMQTYLVHMRQPRAFWKSWREPHLLTFQLVVGGKILSMFVNPLLWLVTITYFVFRAHVARYIEPFFPDWILYLGVFCLVFGNFLYLYYYMIGMARRQYYGLMRIGFLVPLYWLGMSAAAWKALYEIVRKPHYWAKTVHGLHLNKEQAWEQRRETAAMSGGAAAAPGAGTPGRLRLSGAVGAGSVLVLSMVASNFLNFVFNLALGRMLTLEDFATVTLFNTVLSIFSVGLFALGSAVNYKTAVLVGGDDIPSAERFSRAVRANVWKIALGLSAAWLLCMPLFQRFFNVDSLLLVGAFTPVIALGSVAAAQGGYLRGRFRFDLFGQSIVYEALSKAVAAIALAWLGQRAWTSLAIPFSVAVSFASTFMFVRLLRRRDGAMADADGAPPAFPAWYFAASVINGFATTVFLNVDVLLAKHYLDPAAAGSYALLSLVGKMVYFMGTLLSPFVVSVVGRHEGAGTDPERDFYRLLGGTLLAGGGAFAFVALLGGRLVPAFFGSRSLGVVPYLVPYCAAMALFALTTMIISYHVARKQYSFPALMLASSVFLVAGIVHSHQTIAQFSRVMAAAGAVSFAAVFGWHLVRRNSEFLWRALIDFFGAFTAAVPRAAEGGKKRILIFNWRDTSHSFAGGAEVYTQELARRWAAAGNHVTLFCGNDGSQPRAEVREGIHIVRRGGFYMVYVWAFVYYMLQFRGKYDVILDCHNGIPFFTPLFARETVYCLMHHVHQQVFYRYLWWPLARFAAFLERTMMPLVYRQTRFITVSDSSRGEIMELGLGKEGLDVVHPGVNADRLEPGEKDAAPIVLYLGRLKAYKSVDVLIRAFARVAERLPAARLVIAGEGEERGRLGQLAESLGLSDKVAFAGRVTEEEKISLLKRAWVFCNPSLMEGWGITSIEANACGVPVVASDVPGLRDSVRNPHTGYLVEYGNAEKFAEKILHILMNRDVHDRMRDNSLAWARNFDWDRSAARSLAILYGQPAE